MDLAPATSALSRAGTRRVRGTPGHTQVKEEPRRCHSAAISSQGGEWRTVTALSHLPGEQGSGVHLQGPETPTLLEQALPNFASHLHLGADLGPRVPPFVGEGMGLRAGTLLVTDS